MHLLPELANKDAGSIRKQDLATHFARKLKEGSSVELVNRTIRVLKAVLNFALDKEMAERNVMTRFRPYEGRGERAVKAWGVRGRRDPCTPRGRSPS